MGRDTADKHIPPERTNMASRYELELTVSSAKDLKNVNWRHGPNRPYAVVWVDPEHKCSTRVDEVGDTSPIWDHSLTIPLPPGPLEEQTLYIDIVHAGREEDTKPLIGSARLKLSEVLDEVGFNERVAKSLKLKRPSGRPQGKLEVSVCVKEPAYRARDPYYAPPYANPHYGAPYSAPPPPNPYYATAPPPSGYPYAAAPPPPQPVYGQPDYRYEYPQEEKKKSKFGGMGTGLAVGAVAGVLGGLALSEGVDALEDHIADEAAEKVEEDLGYDDGDDF